MKYIENETHDEERAFYNSNEMQFYDIKIEGPKDGESAFKESKNIIVNSSVFKLRYPFWHNNNLSIFDSKLYSTCRAPFWYDRNVTISNTTCEGVKAIRECNFFYIENCKFTSDEICWRSQNIHFNNCEINGVYPLFNCKNIKLEKVKLFGKYSFQYCKNVDIVDSTLDTKDAFWHCKNVVVRNSTIKGEYLGWYSKKVTFINCTISGTQPLCYAKNIRFINCVFNNCDLCFEYSSVFGDISGEIASIKNPKKGRLFFNNIPLYIKDDNDKSKGKFKIIKK